MPSTISNALGLGWGDTGGGRLTVEDFRRQYGDIGAISRGEQAVENGPTYWGANAPRSTLISGEPGWQLGLNPIYGDKTITGGAGQDQWSGVDTSPENIVGYQMLGGTVSDTNSPLDGMRWYANYDKNGKLLPGDAGISFSQKGSLSIGPDLLGIASVAAPMIIGPLGEAAGMWSAPVASAASAGVGSTALVGEQALLNSVAQGTLGSIGGVGGNAVASAAGQGLRPSASTLQNSGWNLPGLENAGSVPGNINPLYSPGPGLMPTQAGLQASEWALPGLSNAGPVTAGLTNGITAADGIGLDALGSGLRASSNWGLDQFQNGLPPSGPSLSPSTATTAASTAASTTPTLREIAQTARDLGITPATVAGALGGAGSGTTGTTGVSGLGSYAHVPQAPMAPYVSDLTGIARYAAQGGLIPEAAEGIAQHGRGNDTMLVHMTPREVGGLQALAQAHGGSLTVNPNTGLPEAGWLDSILPTLAGGAITAFTGMDPLFSAALVGGVRGLTSRDLKSGLMAGLGAYGGAGIASGLQKMGDTSSITGPAGAAEGIRAGDLQQSDNPATYAPSSLSSWEKAIAGAKKLTDEGGLKNLANAMGGSKEAWKYGIAAGTPMLYEALNQASQQQNANMPAFNSMPFGRMPAYTFNMNPRATPVQGHYFDPTFGYTGQYWAGMADGGQVAAYAPGGVAEQPEISGLLEGPGDGVSDSIPAQLDTGEPARLATGEFVIPARIVSELGNGDTKAGAKQLYAMMDRIQQSRAQTTGSDAVAKDTNAEQHLPA